MGGYMESEERAAARWALMQKRAQEIIAAKEAEQNKVTTSAADPREG